MQLSTSEANSSQNGVVLSAARSGMPSQRLDVLAVLLPDARARGNAAQHQHEHREREIGAAPAEELDPPRGEQRPGEVAGADAGDREARRRTRGWR